MKINNKQNKRIILFKIKLIKIIKSKEIEIYYQIIIKINKIQEFQCVEKNLALMILNEFKFLKVYINI